MSAGGDQKVCANPNCKAILTDDETELRDGLCYECWLQKCRDKASEEVEKMLTKFGARKILKDYDGAGAPTGLAFTIGTTHGEMPVKMPVQIQQIRQVLKDQVGAGLLTPKFKEDPWAKEQAARIGWRIIRDWLDAQLTLINVDMVKVEQIFLPYVYSDRLKKTVFDIFEERKFQGILGPGEEEDTPGGKT